MNFFGRKPDSPKTDQPKAQQGSPGTETAPQDSMTYKTLKDPRMLSEAQISRLKEQRRLAIVRMDNIEDSIAQLSNQQMWLRKYCEMKMNLKEAKERLNDLSKQKATMTSQLEQLQRFEKFEGIQGSYMRMKILEEQALQNSQALGKMEQEGEKVTRQAVEQSKLLKQMMNATKLADEYMLSLQDPTFQSFKYTESTKATEQEIEYLEDSMAEWEQQLMNVRSEMERHQEELDLTTQELERHRTGRQSLEMHEHMLEHGEAILLQLAFLQETETNLRTLKQLLSEASHNQDKENQMLGKVFRQYQDILAEGERTENELSNHRKYIHGQNSFKLQERAMMLKSRKQILLSAQSLWNRISTGYNMIDEKTQELNALRQQIEHLKQDIETLESAYGKKSRLCEEKEYNYLLSKGQNVVQLRSQLKEGVSCSVCGAQNHPFHCDTMLEQSKLINEFKTEYELLKAETRNMALQLEELKMELATTRGKCHAIDSTLKSLMARQEEDVKEWEIYASLDKSFFDCTPGTNQDARMDMIRQLLENTERDAEEAQQELDTYNYHQTQISTLSETFQALEQKKNEVSVRLNEINTGCQVMVGHVERLQAQIEAENNRYHHAYNQLGKHITIDDWFNKWTQSHEKLYNNIQQLMNAWQTINGQIAREENDSKVEQAILAELSKQEELVMQKQIATRIRLENCKTQIDQNKLQLERLTDQQRPPQALYLQAQEEAQKARKEEERIREKANEFQRKSDLIKGQTDYQQKLTEELKEKVTGERQRLDIWIHNFNAHHPPIQYAELERVFNQEQDWNDIREKQRELDLQLALAQAKVDNLNSRIVSIQAEVDFSQTENEKQQEFLALQMENLTEKRHEIMLQIARIDLSLSDHERAMSQ